MDTQHEHWAVGDSYEQFMGRWSAGVASRFLEWLNCAPDKRWLDIGSGTGALTRAIALVARPRFIVGLDPSWDFARYAIQRTPDARFVVADGSALAFEGNAFDAVVSGLALNFMAAPEQAVADMHRVVKPGGIVAAYVWDYAGKMEFLRYFWDAAVELDAGAASLHEGVRFPICRPEALRQLWQAAGLHNVTVEAIDIPTVFDSFEHYWQPFTLGNFPAPKFAMALDETGRASLRARLRAIMPTAPDGSIHLIARAWAVTGHR